MYFLEVPQIFSGSRIERQQTIRKQVVSLAIRAVVVVGWRANREIGNPTLLIQRKFSPYVGTADIQPCILGPSVVTQFSRMRDGVKLPDQIPTAHVVGTNIPGRRKIAFTGGRSDDNQVFENLAGRTALNHPYFRIFPTQTLAQIYVTTRPKGLDGFSSRGIDLLQLLVQRKNESAIFFICAGPVGDSALRYSIQLRV